MFGNFIIKIQLTLQIFYLLKRCPCRFPFFMYSYTSICTHPDEKTFNEYLEAKGFNEYLKL
jgi:hypothetical protein